MAGLDHILTAPVDQVYPLLQTRPDGLSDSEVHQRLRVHGPNVVAHRAAYPLWRLVVDQVASPLIYVLLLAAVITTVAGKYADTIVIAAVVVLNGLIGFVQEYRATRAMEALQRLSVPSSRVRRNGQSQSVPSDQLVPGDLLLIEAGTRVPADARLLRAVELLTDESLLTGESVPAEKSADPLDDPETPLAERGNVLFAGSLVIEGRGEAVAFATGAHSELGKIAQTVASVDKSHTPLQRRLHTLANTLTAWMAVLVVVTIGLGVWRQMPLVDILLASVGMAVAAIPEGLPIVVTVVLSLGARRMAEHNALVRKLAAAETMGSTQIIATDKTGTLTRNHMAVRAIVCGPWHLEVAPDATLACSEMELGDGVHCPVDSDEVRQPLHALLQIGVYCNNAQYEAAGGEAARFTGNPTEVALLEAAAALAPDVLHRREAAAPLSEVPFSSARKFMATVQEATPGELWLFAKGAPEVILARCTRQWEPQGLGAVDKSRWMALAETMAGSGQRVVALARRPSEVATVVEDDVQDLALVGFVGIFDPPRVEAALAVRGCSEAGIRVVMVTGDHPATAAEIARQVGILEIAPAAPAEASVVTGRELLAMSDDELTRRLDAIRVYARVTPHDKLRIVEAFQKRGQVVAVTGDGVNDAPALRRADIGIAMGRGGTDAAREASDVVLLDDSFASIYEAVQQGRFIFENIRKVVFFLLSSGLALILATLACLGLGWGLPFTAAQVLWVNLVTNGMQDVALAFQPGEAYVLKRRPMGLKASVLDPVVVQHMVVVALAFGLASVAAYGYALFYHGDAPEAKTLAVTTIVLLQMWHALSCRSLRDSIFAVPLSSNYLLFVSSIIALAAHVAFVYWRPMNQMFSTAPLPWDDWLFAFGLSLVGVLAMEVSKLALRRREARRGVS